MSLRFGKATRRMILGGLGAGALAAGGAGLWLWIGEQRRHRWARPVTRAEAAFSPNVFLSITEDGTTTIWLTKSEMGQGVMTALPMVLAEELDADWTRVTVKQAILGDGYDYGSQFTAASASVQSMWGELRRAGAAARAMLVDAACARWAVGARDCRTEEGTVVHVPSDRRLGYGSLAVEAAAQRVPLRAALKEPSTFRLLGRPLPRLDTPDKTRGQARYALDVRLPGLLRAVVLHPPALGARPREVDDRAARAIPGVRHVITLPDGIGVIADNTWAALKGREALQARWSPGVAPELDSAGIAAALSARAEETGAVARARGDIEAALSRSARKLEAAYDFPYLAHATMEPPSCTAHVTKDHCEVWAATQDPGGARARAAEAARVPPENVRVHTMFLGGGFGRKTMPDDVAQAVALARAAQAPVQLLWTRQDDLRCDRFREASTHRVRAGLDETGKPTAFFHRLITPSETGQESARGEINGIATGGANDWPYAIPNVRCEWLDVAVPVPTGIWRAVGYTTNTFVVESFLDELAHAGGQDPVALRLSLLAETPRLRRCVERAAANAEWQRPRAPGRALGIAAVRAFGSTIAHVAEVGLEPDGGVRVHKLWAALDCGFVLHPDIVAAQIEGAAVYALSAALHGRIDVHAGAIVQSNFHDYPILRLSETPEIAIDILPSAEPPSGVGELGVPSVAPAIGNALFSLTGQRQRALPFSPTPPV